MIKKMKERRIAKTTNIKEHKRLNNQLRRETDRAKEVYMKEICKEIMTLQKKCRYDLMYQKAQLLGGRTSKAIRTFGIEDTQGKIVTDHRRALGIWEKYIQDLYDSENRPKDIAIEVEDELDEDDKEPIILKSEIVKAIKDMRRKKTTGDDNIPVDLLKELGDNGLKIMTTLVNKINI
jgi:hypothetical protein